jgi:hypothetical protein
MARCTAVSAAGDRENYGSVLVAEAAQTEYAKLERPLAGNETI